MRGGDGSAAWESHGPVYVRASRELVHDELRAVRGRGDQAGRRVPQDGRQAVAAPQDESREGDGRTHPRRSAQDSRVLKHIALAMRE